MNTTLIMASAVYTPPYSSLSSSSRTRKSTTLSTSIALNPNALNLSSSTFIPLLGFPHFSPWIGLKQLGISITRHSVKPGISFSHLGRSSKYVIEVELSNVFFFFLFLNFRLGNFFSHMGLCYYASTALQNM